VSSLSNKAASVHQRLLNRARAEGGDFQTLLTRYVLERFLYRLCRSPHREHFVVKGAMLFVLWEGNLHRMTRDLDLLGFGPANSIPEVEQAIREIAATEVEDDGVEIEADTICEEQEYEGVRVKAEPPKRKTPQQPFKSLGRLEPMSGLEPLTCSLRMSDDDGESSLI
jgi:hypothetical protein